MNEMTCEQFHQLEAEVALGVTDARDRTTAFAHLQDCPSCRRELGQLSDVADMMAVLAPAVEPPAGFESRLLARLEEVKEGRPAPVARGAPSTAVGGCGRGVGPGGRRRRLGDR